MNRLASQIESLAGMNMEADGAPVAKLSDHYKKLVEYYTSAGGEESALNHENMIDTFLESAANVEKHKWLQMWATKKKLEALENESAEHDSEALLKEFDTFGKLMSKLEKMETSFLRSEAEEPKKTWPPRRRDTVALSGAGGGGAGGPKHTGCWNCGKDGHRAWECTEPVNQGNIDKNRKQMRDYKKENGQDDGRKEDPKKNVPKKDDPKKQDPKKADEEDGLKTRPRGGAHAVGILKKKGGGDDTKEASEVRVDVTSGCPPDKLRPTADEYLMSAEEKDAKLNAYKNVKANEKVNRAESAAEKVAHARQLEQLQKEGGGDSRPGEKTSRHGRGHVVAIQGSVSRLTRSSSI
mmetsp:Transcript_31088/g.78714  ORF Transcript_31088/g.78714 Transcript_31088/m.78714 type:complete len:352 (-) Transcript_31088:576-1631(-)